MPLAHQSRKSFANGFLIRAAVGLFATVLMHPRASPAATQQEYTEASAKWLDLGVRQKTMGVVRRVLEQPLPRPAGKKQMVYGRGEVMPARPLAKPGTTTLPEDVAQARVTETTGSVRLDGFQLNFGSSQDGPKQALFTVSKGKYSAAILEEGAGQTKLHENQ